MSLRLAVWSLALASLSCAAPVPQGYLWGAGGGDGADWQLVPPQGPALDATPEPADPCQAKPALDSAGHVLGPAPAECAPVAPGEDVMSRPPEMAAPSQD